MRLFVLAGIATLVASTACKPRDYNGEVTKSTETNSSWKPAMELKLKQQDALHAAAKKKAGVGNVCTFLKDGQGVQAWQKAESVSWVFQDEKEYAENVKQGAVFYRVASGLKMGGYINPKIETFDYGYLIGWSSSLRSFFKVLDKTTDLPARKTQLPSEAAVGGQNITVAEYWAANQGSTGSLLRNIVGSENGLVFGEPFVDPASTLFRFETGNQYPVGNFSTTIENPFLHELAATFMAVKSELLSCK